MFDVVTYALLKKQISQAATGISKVEYKDGNLIFTLADGSIISTPVPISSGVEDVVIGENNQLTFTFSDGTTLTYAAASQEDLQELDKKVSDLGTNFENLEKNHNTLNEAFNDLGLSVVDGKLNITFEKENE